MRPATSAMFVFVMRKLGLVAGVATVAYLMFPWVSSLFDGVEFAETTPPRLGSYVVEVEDPAGRLAQVWSSDAEGRSGRTVGLVKLFPRGASGVSPAGVLVVPPTGGPVRWVSREVPQGFVASTMPLAVHALLDDAVRLDAGLHERFLFGGEVVVDVLSEEDEPAPAARSPASPASPAPSATSSGSSAGLLHAIVVATLIAMVQLLYEQRAEGTSHPKDIERLCTPALLEHHTYAWGARAVIAVCGMLALWSYATESGQHAADIPLGTGAIQVVLTALVLGGLMGLHRVVDRIDDACVETSWMGWFSAPLAVMTVALGMGSEVLGLPTDGAGSWALGLLPGVGIGHALVRMSVATTWMWAGVVLVHAVGIELLARWLARDELRARDLWSRLDLAIDRLVPARFATGSSRRS